MSMKLQNERGDEDIKQKGAIETEGNHLFPLTSISTLSSTGREEGKRIDYQ